MIFIYCCSDVIGIHDDKHERNDERSGRSRRRGQDHRHVPDLGPYLSQAGIFAAPIITGAGSKLKLVDVMNHGCATITTPLGAEALPLSDGNNARIIAPEEFADVLEQLLKDPADQRRLGNAAYATAQQYSPREGFREILATALDTIGVTLSTSASQPRTDDPA